MNSLHSLGRFALQGERAEKLRCDRKLSRKKDSHLCYHGLYRRGVASEIAFLLFETCREMCVAVDTSALSNDNKEDRT